MAFPITKSNYARVLKDLNKNYVSDETFNKMYSDVTKSAEQQYGQIGLAESRTGQNLGYDYAQAVNEAYATSMKNADAIQSSALGQGYKAELMAQNQQDIRSAYEQYRQSYLSSLAESQSTYGSMRSDVAEQAASQYNSIVEAQQAQNKAFEAEAENLQKYFDAHYDYVNYLFEQNPDIANMEMFRPYFNEDGTLKDDVEISKLFSVDPTTGEPTLEAQKALAAVDKYTAQGDVTSFTDYLAAKDVELGEWATLGREDYDGKSYAEVFKDIYGLRDIDPGSNLDYRAVEMFKNIDAGQYFDAKVVDEMYVDSDAQDELESGEWKLSGDAIDAETFITEEQGKLMTKGNAGRYSGDKGSVHKAVKEAIENGTLKNGTIIDLNYGGGTNFYMYKDGNFYKMEKSALSGKTTTLDTFKNEGNNIYSKDGKEYFLDEQNELNLSNDELLKNRATYTFGKEGGKRDTIIDEVSKRIKEGSLVDGTVIDINYGLGNPVYVYYKNGTIQWLTERG